MKFEENLRELRKQNGLSQEELADRLGVSRQAVSKWENGSGYPELDKLMTLCTLFHCSMDDLLKGDVSERDVVGIERYENYHNRRSVMMTIGVFLIFCGLMSGAFLEGIFFGNDEAIIGIIFFIFVTIGVMIFINIGMQADTFKKRYPKIPENIYTEDELNDFDRRFRVAMVTGVGIILVSFAIYQLLELMLEEYLVNTIWTFIISIASSIFVYFGMQKSKYDETIPKDYETIEKEKQDERVGKWSGCIMIAATAIFLLWSFIFHAWSISWIVFPVGGLLCGIVSIVFSKK